MNIYHMLHGGSIQTRPAGHSVTVRPPRTSCENSWQQCFFVSVMEVVVAVHLAQFIYYHSRTDPNGQKRGRAWRHSQSP